jgi:ATP citrate (pro-S)-lyase
MAAKSIHEADGKAILSYHLTRSPVIAPSPLPAPKHNPPPKLASITFPTDASPAAILDGAEQMYPWLLEPGAKFVAKPDQLIKRRGKAGLLALNKEWSVARAWIEERAGKEIQVESVKGCLRTFLVEPFCPHKPEEEYYINIHSMREVCAVKFWLSSVFIFLRCFGVCRSAGSVLERKITSYILCLGRTELGAVSTRLSAIPINDC